MVELDSTFVKCGIERDLLNAIKPYGKSRVTTPKSA